MELPFDELARTPVQHFRLHYFASVAHVLSQVAVSFPTPEAAFQEFPFLIGYHEELAAKGVDDLDLEGWQRAIEAWEQSVQGHLPLRALREHAGLSSRALLLLLSVGLNEEDARFGLLFATLQGTPGVHRPTLGLLNAWWRATDDGGEAASALRGLRRLGLTRVVNPEAARVDQALEVPAALWDALRGDVHDAPAPWLRYRAPEDLTPAAELVLPEELRDAMDRLPALLAEGEVRALVVRGPRQSGRRTLVGAVAQRLDRGLLELRDLGTDADDRARQTGTLALLLRALPVVALDAAPGETLNVPEFPAGPVAVVLGRHGGVAGPNVEKAIHLTLGMPDAAARRAHWQTAGGLCDADRDALAEGLRLTGGHIRRTARLAQAQAALDGRDTFTATDARQAARALHRQALDALATRLDTSGDWSRLATATGTQRELRDLERRCRHRERLPALLGPALQHDLRPGVRALFQGPSGTGKTLAARLLAAELSLDIYRVDLASVVNKYIGETEKNLARVFSLAEELDVVLLLDEGDALLGRRTSVQSANDRYANLETNYLLQRIESFEGILLLTTNAPDHIDTAFQRRMDVVVDFRAPEPNERWAIWQLHLPLDHRVDTARLREVALRCELSGGQIRNAAVQAALLALDDRGVLGNEQLEAAVVREYRKAGAVCPLRRSNGPGAPLSL